MSRRLPALVLLAAALCAPGSLPAGDRPTSLPAGEYFAPAGIGGHSLLTLGTPRAGSQPFTIETLGANAHVCDISGEIRNGQSRVPLDETDSNGEACLVTFRRDASGDIEVAAGSDACRHFCGARAYFDDSYSRVAAGCRSAQTRSLHARAEAALATRPAQTQRLARRLLERCTLSWMQQLELRRLLVLASDALGDARTCRAAISDDPQLHGALLDPVEMEQMPLPPFEHGTLTSVLDAIRPAAVRCGVLPH